MLLEIIEIQLVVGILEVNGFDFVHLWDLKEPQMNINKYVFAQMTAFLDRNHFNYLVRKYDGNKYVKHFTCWNQFLAMMFGQLSNRESLRDLIVVLEAHGAKCYHLGIGRNVSKTTLANAT